MASMISVESSSHNDEVKPSFTSGSEELQSSKDLKGSDEPLSEECIAILKEISVSGIVKHEWSFLKRIFALKMIQVLKNYFAEKGFMGLVEHNFDQRNEELLTLLNKFEHDAPFTVQRLAEVLSNSSQYQSTHKFINCLEKLLSVTSSVPTRS